MIRFENDLRTRGEQLVLCCLLNDNGCIRHIADLRPQHFSHDLHGEIFRHALALIEASMPADLVSVYGSMLAAGKASTGTLAYLGSLCRLNARPSNVGWYAVALLARASD
jgi:replicative DNA helicase